MSKKIKLEITEKEFAALTELIESAASMLSCSDEEYSNIVRKGLKTTNKMFERNKINYKFTQA